MTLDASVKIYGSRVDSVHTIAFQTLSGLSRSSACADAGAHSCAHKSRLGCTMTVIPVIPLDAVHE